MKETKIMRIYRISNFLYNRRIPLLPKLITRFIRLMFSAEIPCSCTLGKGVQLKHGGLGIVIHDKAIIGDNTVIFQHVTIGGRESSGTPTIGRNVYIGVGACILGNVFVGDNSKIGANAVVVKDVPQNVTVVGVPANILIKKEKSHEKSI